MWVKIGMPEQYIKKIKEKIKIEWLCAFGITVIVGLIAHIYKFTNHLPNWDSLMDYYYPSHNMIHQGRQFQFLPAAIRGFADQPWLIGILCLIYMGISMAAIVDIMDMHKPLSIAMSAAVVVVSPTVISGWGFMFTADGFASAYMLSVLAVFVTLKKRWGWIVGGILLAVSMGIYQAYLPVAMALILLWLLKEILTMQSHHLDKLFWKQMGRFLLLGCEAVVLYKLSLEFLSYMEAIPVVDHQGIGSIHFPNMTEIVNAVISSYVDSVYYFTGSISDLSIYGILNAIAIICLGVFIISLVIKQKLYKQWDKLFLMIISIILYPCVSHIFYFITNGVEYHALMQFPLVLPYVLLFCLYEETKEYLIGVHWASVVSMLLLGYVLILAANQAYRAETLSYEKTYAMVGRMVDRMEQLPEYNEAKHIAIIGNLEGTDNSILGDSPALAGYTEGFFITHQKHVVAMLDEYFGVCLTGVDDAAIESLQTLTEVKAMPQWPQNGSVIQIDDTIVVKLSEKVEQ